MTLVRPIAVVMDQGPRGKNLGYAKIQAKAALFVTFSESCVRTVMVLVTDIQNSDQRIVVRH